MEGVDRNSPLLPFIASCGYLVLDPPPGNSDTLLWTKHYLGQNKVYKQLLLA